MLDNREGDLPNPYDGAGDVLIMWLLERVLRFLLAVFPYKFIGINMPQFA